MTTREIEIVMRVESATDKDAPITDGEKKLLSYRLGWEDCLRQSVLLLRSKELHDSADAIELIHDLTR